MELVLALVVALVVLAAWSDWRARRRNLDGLARPEHWMAARDARRKARRRLLRSWRRGGAGGTPP